MMRKANAAPRLEIKLRRRSIKYVNHGLFWSQRPLTEVKLPRSSLCVKHDLSMWTEPASCRVNIWNRIVLLLLGNHWFDFIMTLRNPQNAFWMRRDIENEEENTDKNKPQHCHQCVSFLITYDHPQAVGNASVTESRGLITQLLMDTSSCTLPDNAVYTSYFTAKTPLRTTDHPKRQKWVEWVLKFQPQHKLGSFQPNTCKERGQVLITCMSICDEHFKKVKFHEQIKLVCRVWASGLLLWTRC